MNTITTKRSLLKFYAASLFAALFLSALGSFAIFNCLDPEERKGFRPGGESILIVLGGLMIFMAFYTVYRYFKNAPIISADHNKISFGSSNYYWADVGKIELTGKQPFRYVFEFPMEGVKFTMKDGQEKYLFDDMYANAWQVKLFIQEVILNKSKVFELPAAGINKSEFDYDVFETYIGNQFTSLRGISFWPLFVILVYALFFGAKTDQYSGLVIVVPFALFWFLFNAWLMNYFRVSENFIVVKNHLAFWKNNGYRLSDIKEVAFETRDKMPNCLRIITKDFRSKLYPAGTLRDKTWLEMKDKLESRGITVRNECIHSSLGTTLTATYTSPPTTHE
jgi:hypothetical protein